MHAEPASTSAGSADRITTRRLSIMVEWNLGVMRLGGTDEGSRRRVILLPGMSPRTPAELGSDPNFIHSPQSSIELPPIADRAFETTPGDETMKLGSDP